VERFTMKIEGMTCGHCVASVNRALKSVASVEVEQVKVGTATVAFDPDHASIERIAQAVADEGYIVVSSDTSAPR
jgi:copper chaperone